MSPTIGADESNYPYPQPNTDFSYPDTIYVANEVDFLSMASTATPYKYRWYVDGVLKDTLHDFTYIFPTAISHQILLGYNSIMNISPECFPYLNVQLNPFAYKFHHYLRLYLKRCI